MRDEELVLQALLAGSSLLALLPERLLPHACELCPHLRAVDRLADMARGLGNDRCWV